MINPDDYPLIHEILEGETEFSFRFIWEYHDESILCNIPLLNTEVQIRELSHTAGSYIVSVNRSHSPHHNTNLADLTSEVENQICHSVFSFILNCTNIQDLVPEITVLAKR